MRPCRVAFTAATIGNRPHKPSLSSRRAMRPAPARWPTAGSCLSRKRVLNRAKNIGRDFRTRIIGCLRGAWERGPPWKRSSRYPVSACIPRCRSHCWGPASPIWRWCTSGYSVRSIEGCRAQRPAAMPSRPIPGNFSAGRRISKPTTAPKMFISKPSTQPMVRPK